MGPHTDSKALTHNPELRHIYGTQHQFRILELALYHSLGKLSEPELTHEFFWRGAKINSLALFQESYDTICAREFKLIVEGPEEERIDIGPLCFLRLGFAF
jgi:hypothetical protein